MHSFVLFCVLKETPCTPQKDRLKAVSNLDKVAILAEALPYLQKFHGVHRSPNASATFMIPSL